MGFINPAEPEFDMEEWAEQPHGERIHMMCKAWAMQGFGAPDVIYLIHVVKIAIYIGGFLAFAATTGGVGGLGDISSWWAEPIVFAKAVLWTMVYESLGFGCGSGPLTGRYVPPFTAGLAFLRPGTIRLAPFPRLPFTSGNTRTVADVALYAAFVILTFRALLSDDLTRGVIAPIIIAMVLLGLRDKTAFLAARSEHYLLATFVMLFPHDMIAGQKAIQAGLWFWAATSKVNHHFPSVIAVMTSNNPLIRSRAIKRKLYVDFPDDLRPSMMATTIAHLATVAEYMFPLLLVLGSGGWVTTVAVVAMIAFHSGIFVSFPLGVPLEWNVFFIYSLAALFGSHADVRLWSIDSPWLVAVLIVALVAIPLWGNLRPDQVSFLPAMRYYAGNWATGTWLTRPGLLEKIEDSIVTPSSTPRRQFIKLYGNDDEAFAIQGRAGAFRAMHLHGRALPKLFDLAIADLADDPDVVEKGVDAFEFTDGELVAGLALGWNFGDGHLHDEQLIGVLRERVGFEPGEGRVIFMESQPLGKPTMHWRIIDLADGQIAEGRFRVADLLAVQPWGGDYDIGLAEQDA